MSRFKINRLPTKLALTLMSCGLLLAAGCGGQADDAPGDDSTTSTYALEDTQHTRNVRVFDNVKRLDDRAAHAVHIDGDHLLFPKNLADSLAIYEPGDVMATATGKGLLRRVVSIEESGDAIVVETEPASLAEVFASGEIYVAAHAEPNIAPPESFRYEALAPSELNGSEKGDFATRQQGLEVDYDDPLFSWDRDFASDLNTLIANELGTDRLTVDEASVDVDLGGEFYANAGTSVFPPSFELKTLRAGANGTANATLRVTVSSDDSFNFDRTFYLVSTDSSHSPFYQLDEKSFDVAGLVQLTFNGNSRLDLSASVDGTASATGEVQLNGNIRGGIERKSGTWQPYTDGGISPSGYGPEFDGEKNFEAQAKLTTTLNLDVADAASGSLVVEPATVTVDFRQDIDAGSGECPNHFNVNVKGELSGQLEKLSVAGFDISLMDSPSSWTMYDKNFLTRDGQLEFAGVCDPNYEPPSFGDGGRGPRMVCQETADCDGGLACFRDRCVTEGPIRFSVAWFEDTDVDIQVTTPSGEVVDWRSYTNGVTDGLVYDFPICTGKCQGPAPYVENIYSENAPQPGTYIIEVVHGDKRADSDFALLIEHDGKVRNEGGKLPAEGESVRFEYTVN